MVKKKSVAAIDTLQPLTNIFDEWRNEDHQLRKEINRRVTLVVSSIVESFLSGDNPDHTTIRAVLNRLVVLLQIPVTFVIFEKSGANTYSGVVCFNKYSRDQEKIANAIGSKGGDVSSSWVREPFSILDGDYFLVPIIIQRDDKKGVVTYKRMYRLKRDATPYTNHEVLSYAIEEALNIKNYKSYGIRVKDALEKSIIQSRDEMANSLILDSIYSHPILRIKENRHVHQQAFLSVLNNISHDGGIKNTASVRKEFSKTLRNMGEEVDKAFFQNKDFMTFPIQGNSVFDRIIRKTSKNLDFLHKFGKKIYKANNNNFQPNSNYVVFLRNYSGLLSEEFSSSAARSWDFEKEPYLRHEEVSHSENGVHFFDFVTKIAIGAQQEEDIIGYFNGLSHQWRNEISLNQSSGAINRYSHQVKDAVSPVWRKLAKVLDRYFWETLIRVGGINEFIAILRKPFGRQARSASDLVFEHGVIHFARPFANGGLMRCFPNELNEPHESHAERVLNKEFARFGDLDVSILDSNDLDPYLLNAIDDLKRLVICYYWYSGMIGRKFFPDGNTETEDAGDEFDMGIMLVPIEVGGRIWSVVGYFSPIYDRTSETYAVDDDLNASSWDFNYHVYNEIHDRLKKDLRHSVIDLYYKLHAHVYSEIAKPEFSNLLYSKDDPVEYLERFLNLRFAALGAYLPTDILKVQIQDGLSGPRLVSKNDETEVDKVVKGVVMRMMRHGSPSSEGTEGGEGQSVRAGVYLTDTLGCSTNFYLNPFFPSPLGANLNLDTPGRHLKERDLQMAMSSALAYAFMLHAHQSQKYGAHVTSENKQQSKSSG